jgi:hypothetical protein
MAGMANLIVNMIARTEQFQGQMKKASSTIGSFNKSISGIRSTLGSFGVALSAAGVGYFIARQLEAVDTALEFADSMDIGIEKLRKLEYAAAQSGLGVDLLRLTIAKMSANIDTAFEKGKFLAGLDPAKLMAMDTVDAFMALREAINKIPNSYARATAAVEIFGRGGRQFLGFLGKTNEEFRANYDAAEEFYVITDKMAGKMEESNNQLKQMQLNLSGVSTKLISELTPAIKGILFLLTKSAEGWVTLLKELKETLKFRTGFGWLTPKMSYEELEESMIPTAEQKKAGDKKKWIENRIKEIEYEKNKVANAKKIDELQRQADQIYSKTKSPLENYKDRISEINKLLGMEWLGEIMLGPNFGSRAKAQAKADYEKDIKMDNRWRDMKFQELNPSMINVRGLSGRIDPMLTETQKQTRLLQEIKIGITAGGLN